MQLRSSLPKVAMVSDIDNATISFFVIFFLLKHWSCFILRNTLTVNAPSPSGWTCLWRLKEQPVRGDTASHSHPAPVLRGLVQLYNKEEGGLVSCKHALSLLGSVNTLTGTHTHKCGFVVEEGGVRSKRGIYDMTSSERVMECCVMLCLVFQH